MRIACEAVREQRLTAILLTCMVIVSAVVGGWWLVSSQNRGSKSSLLRSDGPTLHQAIAELSPGVANQSGGPWALFSAYGIAAQVPFSPNLIGYAHTNVTVNSCGQAFDGLTLWNGTIPLFDGTFNSGTAPFWQFAYFSNSTQEILLATDVLGDLRLYPPIAYPSACMPWYDLPGNVANWTSDTAVPSIDSSEAAQVVWNAILQGSDTVGDWTTDTEPDTEIITFGPGVFMGLGDASSAYGVYLDRCGEVGVTGVQPLILAGVGSTGQLLGASDLTHNCALINSGEGAYDSDYDLLFGQPTLNTNAATTMATAGFQVAIALPNGTLVKFFDEVGLASWMTSWNLSTPLNTRLPLGMPACASWVPSVEDCVANSSGWYAVILSANGEWINSFGALPNGTAVWSEPVTAIVSHQQLVIVIPSSWNLAGDVLAPNSTVSTSTVIGSLTL